MTRVGKLAYYDHAPLQLDRQIIRAKCSQLDLKGIVEDRSAIHKLEAHVALIQNRIKAAKMLRKSYTMTVTPLRQERAAFELMVCVPYSGSAWSMF